MDVAIPWTGTERERLRDAFEEHYVALVRLAMALSGSREAAEDIAQEAFVRVASRIGSVPAGEAWPYLRRVAVNLWKDRRRRLRLELRIRNRFRPDPSRTERPRADRADLWPLVLALPARQRACLVLRYYEDLSERETADVLGVSVGTIKSQTSRALAKLRKEYRDADRA